MSFLRAARAALPGQTGFRQVLVAMVVVLAGFSLSCGSSYDPSKDRGPNHIAYVTLPSTGQVLLLNINGVTGAITSGPATPQVANTTPTGLALLPSRKFLYAINSRANTISIFSIANDGTLTQTAAPTPAGDGPNMAVIDPSGKYLLVTNNYGNSVSVYSIDPGSGALSEVANSPFEANANPTQILITPSGQYVYVTNPGIGMVTAFSFSNGVLTQVSGVPGGLPGSPYVSGAGASALAVDGSGRFLYVVNPSASNPQPYQNTVGNISGFNIDPGTGALTPMLGSPFYSTEGVTGPTAITVDLTGSFVFALTPGSSYSFWSFEIDSTTGELTAITSSPFSLAAGGLFALADPTGDFLYVGSQSGKNIAAYTYNQNTGVPTAVSGSPFSIGAAPGMMVFSQ
jgi:6-phosphogluconolactonase (cycloisomerase 2 family)